MFLAALATAMVAEARQLPTMKASRSIAHKIRTQDRATFSKLDIKYTRESALRCTRYAGRLMKCQYSLSIRPIAGDPDGPETGYHYVCYRIVEVRQPKASRPPTGKRIDVLGCSGNPRHARPRPRP